jgi:hypothetical protein
MLAARSYIFEGGPLNLLRNTASIAARFFFPIWLIATIFVLPACLLTDLVAWQANPPPAVLLLVYPIVWVATYFASFVIVGEVSDICLGGTASFSRAIYKTSVRGAGRLLGTDILVGLVVLAAMIVPTLASLFIGVLVDAPIIILLGTAIGVVGGLLFVWPFLFTAQVVAIERRYWFSALKRSASIVWRSKGRSLAVFGLFVLISLVWQIVIMTIYFIDAAPTLAGLAAGKEFSVSLSANMIGSLLYAAYVPIPNIFLTLAYYDLQRMDGGLSVEMLEDLRAYEMS